VVVSRIYTIADIAADQHFAARDMILHVDDATLGRLAVPGFVPKMTATPATHRWVGPAEVGAHNEEVYGRLLGIDRDELARLTSAGVI
jgi:formyl-CoA transferase